MHDALARTQTQHAGAETNLTRRKQTLTQVLADADDSDEVDYNLERARLESLFGGTA